MLSSKEALEGLIDAYISWRAYQTRECIENDYRYKKLLKDLDRLEELEKVIEILKDKKVNLFHIWIFNDYEQYKEHYPFAEYSAEEDMLNAEEFDLLKEWLENDK